MKTRKTGVPKMENPPPPPPKRGTIRKEGEIRERLQNAELAWISALQWYNDALKTAEDNEKFWGNDQDRGEVDTANNEVKAQGHEVETLKWVLNIK